MFKYFLLIVIALFSLTAEVLAEPLPRIESAQTVFDFGEVQQGQSVTHTFMFRNVGAATLLVDRVKSTCGCTGVLLSAKSILPGGEGTVKATFNSSRFKGKVEKKILLYSNDPAGKPVTFTVTGVVRVPLEVNPGQLSFGQMTVGQTKTVVTALTNLTDQTIKIVNLRTSNNVFRAEVDSDILESNATTQMRVVAMPKARAGHLGGSVWIRLDQSDGAEIRVALSGSVVPVLPDK